MTTTDLTLTEIEQLASDCLTRAGADAANAGAVARTVTLAERDGSISHGLFRIPGYMASLRSGKVNGQADPKPEQVTPALIRCDGQNGYAPLAHERCTQALADAAQQLGVAVLALQRSHHFAALWPEVEALAGQGLAAFTCVSYMPAVAPAGGSSALFGTNPMAFAWPGKDGAAMVMDMATAAMARGEVAVAARDGHSVPPGTGLDKEGQPTTDPAKILEGVLLPFGGYKGSALAMMVELLAGPLVGEGLSYQTAANDNKDGGPPQGGQFVLALSPKLIGGTGPETADEFFSKLAAMPGVRVPGSRRLENRKDNGARSVDTALVEKLRAEASAG